MNELNVVNKLLIEESTLSRLIYNNYRCRDYEIASSGTGNF